MLDLYAPTSHHKIVYEIVDKDYSDYAGRITLAELWGRGPYLAVDLSPVSARFPQSAGHYDLGSAQDAVLEGWLFDPQSEATFRALHNECADV